MPDPREGRSGVSISVNVSLADDQAGEQAGHRLLMQERVRGLLQFQHLDAALSTPIMELVNRRLHCPRRFTAQDEGRLAGLVEARRALWEGRDA